MYKHIYDTLAKHWCANGSIYFYSDPHFGDLESYKYFRFPELFTTDCNVEETIKALDKMQIDSINKVCTKNDCLIILGDVGNVDCVKKLKAGYKVLIMGNHDAGAQLARLENYVCREKLAQPQQEEHIKTSIENAMRHWDEKYAKFENGSIKLFIDKAVNPDMETEMFVDINLKHYPLRDYKTMWAEMNEIVKTYKNIGARNSKAMEHNKLNKHIMHLFRLYLMCIDILEKEEINTYREKDHDYLMAIRNGYYMNEDGTIKPELYKELDLLKSKMKDLEKTTKLPEKPYYKDAENLLIGLNKMSLDISECKKTNIGFLSKY